MKLSDVWVRSGENIKAYFLMLESLDMEENSICYKLNSITKDFQNYTCSLKSPYIQYSFGKDEDFYYAMGGISALPVYSSSVEYLEYQEDIRGLKKLLNST